MKGVGEGAVQSIVEEREKNGPFKGIFDFVQRVNLTACNKKNLECLALAGGFDSFPELKREQYFAVTPRTRSSSKPWCVMVTVIRPIRLRLQTPCSVVRMWWISPLRKYR